MANKKKRNKNNDDMNQKQRGEKGGQAGNKDERGQNQDDMNQDDMSYMQDEE